MKSYLIAILALSVAVAGCASLKPPPVSATANADSPAKSPAQTVNRGWYLMQPPIRHGNPDSAAQLADWQPIAFFEHSAQCDAARAQGLSAYSSYVEVSTSSAPDSVELSRSLASSTLCVAADDYRINWFHFQWKWK